MCGAEISYQILKDMKALLVLIFSFSFINLFAQESYDTLRIENSPKQVGSILEGSFFERDLYP